MIEVDEKVAEKIEDLVKKAVKLLDEVREIEKGIRNFAEELQEQSIKIKRAKKK